MQRRGSAHCRQQSPNRVEASDYFHTGLAWPGVKTAANKFFVGSEDPEKKGIALLWKNANLQRWAFLPFLLLFYREAPEKSIVVCHNVEHYFL